MRSAGQEVLDANVAGGLQDSEAASPTAQIRELSRLRKAHMAAAEQIRLKEYEIAERDRENLEALPSSDGPLFTLSGKTEAQLIRELQFKRRLAAKDPRISRLPEPSSETIPRTASVMPALPQPSVSQVLPFPGSPQNWWADTAHSIVVPTSLSFAQFGRPRWRLTDTHRPALR